jgi:hypothetical protein
MTGGGERAFTVGRRFNGPANSANGGYVCGLIAELAAPFYGPEVTVTLHAPPPLDTELVLRAGRRRGHVFQADDLIATVATSAAPPAALPPVPLESALLAEQAFSGAGHPFPTCFVCGPERAAGDGLRLRPGRLPGRPGEVACTWVPDSSVVDTAGRVPLPVLWGVLDCPGGWTADPVGAPAVLGRMSVSISTAVPVDQPCVVVARLVERGERTSRNSSAIYDSQGRLAGTADAFWVRVDPVALQAVHG